MMDVRELEIRETEDLNSCFSFSYILILVALVALVAWLYPPTLPILRGGRDRL
jgi:hypothetical protein